MGSSELFLGYNSWLEVLSDKQLLVDDIHSIITYTPPNSHIF